jgi:hypothetical protein
MEERLRKMSQTNEDEDCMFLMSLSPSIKRLEHSKTGTENDIFKQLQISKNRSLSVDTVSTESHSSYPPTPPPHAVSLD